MHMVDLMSSIICEGDTVSQELLDTVLVNLVPAHKGLQQSLTSLQADVLARADIGVYLGRAFACHQKEKRNLNKQAYDLAKALLKRTAQAIEPYITNFFNQVLMLGKTSISDLSEHVFDLILELYNIDSHLLLSVLPQLEFKLKIVNPPGSGSSSYQCLYSIQQNRALILIRTFEYYHSVNVMFNDSNDNEERLQVVKLLAKMFGAKDSELASQNKPLWQCYLGRFNDIHVPIRLECVKFASHCLMNHPDLAKDLTEYLKVRSHDPEEAIRHDVIVSIVTAAKKDLLLVNDHLLNFVRERTLDKRWRVRKEAMMGLAQIYKKYSLQSEAGKEAAKQISWIKDKLLHIYYQNSIDDRLLVERIFAQYMVPHNLETNERMKCLYYLYATLDSNAVKALNEMWKCQNLLRHQVKDLVDLIKQPKTDASSKAIFSKVMVITRNLPDPGKAQDFMKKFTQVLEDDEKIRNQLEMLVSPSCSCKQAEGCVREITKKLGNPKQPTNPFLEMIKFLLERIAPVHIDTESISALIKQVNKSIDGTADDEDEGVPTDQAIRAGLELLKVLSFTHPISFHSAETFESLLACLKMDDEKVAEAALQIFKNTGSKIEEDFPHIRSGSSLTAQPVASAVTSLAGEGHVGCDDASFTALVGGRDGTSGDGPTGPRPVPEARSEVGAEELVAIPKLLSMTVVETPASPPAVQSSSSSPDEAITGPSRAGPLDGFREHQALLWCVAENLGLEVQDMVEQEDALFNLSATTPAWVALCVYEGVLKIAKALWQIASSILPISKRAEKKLKLLARRNREGVGPVAPDILRHERGTPEGATASPVGTAKAKISNGYACGYAHLEWNGLEQHISKSSSYESALLPVLHHKAKKGPPRQAKYAIHCIHAIFSSKETQFAQIFEIQAMKMMVRWLLGMKNNHSKSGTSTLRLLTTILHSDGDLTEQGKISKPDMSRLRLAAASAVVKLAQEPCYHEIITLEQYQLCALAVNDECYQVRQIFAQKLHKGLSRLRLPLEYMAICALCAKDPVKERRAHARQCLVKNINVRREYLKQHAAVSEKLLSLLPEYVVPYTIHLLAHDPDYVKVQDIEQLKDIKECLWFILEILMAKNENNSHAFIRKMVENIKQTKDAQGPDDPKMNEKLYTVCDVAMNIIMSKSTTYSLESPKDPVLPARYFTQPDKNFSNTKNYLPPEMKSFFTPGKEVRVDGHSGLFWPYTMVRNGRGESGPVRHTGKKWPSVWACTQSAPKAANVLGAVNKPLSAAGKQSQSKSSRMETVSNASSSSNPSSPGRIKGRLDSTEMDHSENEDFTMASPLPGKKTDKRDDSDLVRSEMEKPRGRKKATITDSEEKLGIDDLNKLGQEQKLRGSQRGRKRSAVVSESDEPQWPEEKRLKEDVLESEDEQNSPPKKGRRGRPPKVASGGTPKEEPAAKTSKRGRKKAVPVASVVEEEEEEEEEGQSENMEQKPKGRQYRTPRRAQQRVEPSETSAVESTQSTPQKRRGRPPKTPPSQQKKVRAGRTKQAASKENESSEEMDIFQGSSPISDDIPQEEVMEEEEVSTISVRYMFEMCSVDLCGTFLYA
ncbi:Sister chromatid cohesion protein PDS5 like protein B [Chelonia mydas]|uniref:Sister chromatid cohesion protein PDS5 like protein B n=1 Tax=Chelonia mydas TaxID=8469 RepID=M7BPE4_CHEMY|nr:Sister chromatid cohesion protein PDS5 like protein B [Chelonia mydas]